MTKVAIKNENITSGRDLTRYYPVPTQWGQD